jgi:hypothetical protein
MIKARYDAKYVAKRDRLIRQAEKYANATAGKTVPFEVEKRHEWAANWNMAFHGKMNELARVIK